MNVNVLNQSPKCKCGSPMELRDCRVIALPATDGDYKWVCPLRDWFNFWKHTAPFREPTGAQ